MLHVIDTATSQRWLNFAAPIAEGYDHVYVKMGGDNVDPTYEAPHYDAQVDEARRLGYKRVGHYWVPNGDPSDADDIDTPEQQSDFMIDNLRNWNPATDFIVEDNESLDGSIRYSDAQLAAAIERKKSRLNIPGQQVLTYLGLHDARSNEWPLTLATGTNFIIAAYSYEPFGWDDFASIPRDRIVGHQLGGRPFAAIPGAPVQQVLTDVNAFLDHAFDYGGGTPMSLEQKAREFATKYPTSASHWRGGDNDWDQDCGRVCYRFAEWLGWATGPDESRVYSAYAVAMASGRLNLNAASAPVGAWHFWDIGGAANGHVGVDLTGGGRRVFMGTWSVAEDWGRAIGVLSVSGYTAAKAGRARYLGWATNYAGGTVNLAAVAGGGYTPIDNTQEGPMFTISEFLNHPAYTHWANGQVHPAPPTVSEAFRSIDILFHAVFNGGGSMKDGGKSISQSLAEINAKAGLNLTEEQLQSIADRVNAGSADTIAQLVAGSLADDFEGLRAALIAQLPPAVRADLKAAL